MPLYELKIEVPLSSAEAADAMLLEYGSPNWSVLEDVIEKRAWVIGLGPDESGLHREWAELEPLFAGVGVVGITPITARAVGDADWRESYKAHFHAWQFGRLHWVPIWQRDAFQLPADDAVLWLDPGLAFGTGNHETTRLCIERLVAIEQALPARAWRRASARVIDAGCGSGILALSAALLGFKRVIGFDNDPEAIRVSGENAALNSLQERVEFFTADLTCGLAQREAEIVLANIQADVLIRFAAELVRSVAPGGALILSGILAGENLQVRTAFQALAPNWAVDSRTMGEWSDVLLERPA